MHLHSEQLSRRIANLILKSYSFDQTTCVLDFACGSGAISQSLASECKSILGIDINQQAVDAYNQRVANQGISSDEMKALRLDLTNPAESAFITEKFDVVVCAQAYHHIADIMRVTETLASMLKQDGKLIVVDLLKSEDSLLLKDSAEGPVAHKGGLTEAEMREAFMSASLKQIVFKPALQITSSERKVVLFEITGVR